MGGRRTLARDLVEDRVGTRQGAAIERDIGKPEGWVSNLLGGRSHKKQLPTIDELNRLSERVGIRAAILTTALLIDRGLHDDQVTDRSLAFAAEYRELGPMGQQITLGVMRLLRSAGL